MKTYIIVSLFLGTIAFLYLKLATRFKIIDKPNQRSSHTKITIRGGGIIFPISVLLFFFFNDYQYPFFVLGVFLISVVSFLDDIYTLSSKIRFPFQFLAILLILHQVSLPLPYSISLMYLAYFFFGVGVVNMFNFMDGINGITGFYSLAVLSGLYFINVNEQLINSELIIYVVLSILIFGYYNFRKKALFFAGDIGSITIGMLIFFIGLLFTVKLSSPLILLTIVIYGADATCTFLYRKILTKENVFKPHRHHIYQKLVDVYKISHLKIAVIYALLQVVVNVIVYKTYNLEIEYQLFVFLGIITVLFITYILMFRMVRKRQLQS